MEGKLGKNDAPKDGSLHGANETQECVPAKAKAEIRSTKTLEGVWRYLDKEYGSPTKLATARVKDLHSFKYSPKAKSEKPRPASYITIGEMSIRTWR